MEKLTCALCGYQDGNLVPHIETEHATEITLKDYIAQHGGTVDCVVHPNLRKEEKMTRFADEGDTVEICGIELKKESINDSTKHFIPAIDEAYHFQDFTADVLKDIAEKRSILLIGHTGTGKTSLVNQIAARINKPVLKVNLNQQTTISDFVGKWGVKGGETKWIDGILPTAMKLGAWLLVDEIDYGEADILSVLNPVTENGYLMLKEKDNEIVVPHEDFRIFATGNAIGQYAAFRHLYQGTKLLNEAFLNRWQGYIVGYLPENLEAKVLQAKVPKLTERICKELIKVASLARKAFEEETLSCTFSTRQLIAWAEMLVRHKHLKEQAALKAAEMVIFSKTSKEDAMALEGMIKRVLFGRN